MGRQIINSRRFIACVIDWYLCSVLMAIPTIIINDTIQEKYIASILISLFALGITVIYYIVISYANNGQTLGKKILKLRITKLNGDDIEPKDLILRELIGVLVIEGSIFAGSNYLRELLQMFTKCNVLVPLSIVSSVITIVSILLLLFSKKSRMIHDYIGNTIVVGL